MADAGQPGLATYDSTGGALCTVASPRWPRRLAAQARSLELLLADAKGSGISATGTEGFWNDSVPSTHGPAGAWIKRQSLSLARIWVTSGPVHLPLTLKLLVESGAVPLRLASSGASELGI